MRSDFKVGIRF